MIVQWFADMFYKVLTGLFGWINIPRFDDEIVNSINSVLDMIGENGWALFDFLIPSVVSDVGMPLLLIIISFKYGYYFILWILKKIPAFGIE